MAVARTPIELVRQLCTRDLKNNNIKVLILVAILRARSHMRLKDFTQIQPTTNDATVAFCKARGLQHSSHTVKCDKGCPSVRLHAILLSNTQSKDGDVLLYFHGGGYANAISGPGHLPFIVQCAEAAQSSTVYILEYKLAPNLQYPGQLQQACSAVRYLLTRHKVGSIMIGGDSAGANLAMALLGHIKSPHPEVERLQRVSNTGGHRFRAVYLLSPWTALRYTASSFSRNSTSDFVSSARLSDLTQAWQPSGPAGSFDVWAEPSSAGESFWRELAANKIFITMGDKEVLYDDIKRLAADMMQGHEYSGKSERKVEYAIGPEEVHVHSALETTLGLPYTGSSAAILNWLREL